MQSWLHDHVIVIVIIKTWSNCNRNRLNSQCNHPMSDYYHTQQSQNELVHIWVKFTDVWYWYDLLKTFVWVLNIFISSQNVFYMYTRGWSLVIAIQVYIFRPFRPFTVLFRSASALLNYSSPSSLFNLSRCSACDFAWDFFSPWGKFLPTHGAKK